MQMESNKYFAANLLEKLTVKIFENQLKISRVTAMSLVSPFFRTQCITSKSKLASKNVSNKCTTQVKCETRMCFWQITFDQFGKFEEISIRMFDHQVKLDCLKKNAFQGHYLFL